MNAAIDACQRSYQAKTQGDAAIAQETKANAGTDITQTSAGLSTAASQMNGLTAQAAAVCETAYKAYWNQCYYSREDLKKMQTWPHKVSREKADHDLPEVEKMQSRAQAIFSGMGEQLAATNASEVKAVEGANETFNRASGGEKFPGCAAGMSGQDCANELTKWYNGERSQPTQPVPEVQAAQPIQQTQPTKVDPYANGPKSLEDCRSGSPSGWSGTEACTNFLYTHYNRGFGALPTTAPAASATPPKSRKPSSNFLPNF